MGPKKDGREETKGEEEGAMGTRCLDFWMWYWMDHVRMGSIALRTFAVGKEIYCTITKSTEMAA